MAGSGWGARARAPSPEPQWTAGRRFAVRCMVLLGCRGSPQGIHFVKHCAALRNMPENVRGLGKDVPGLCQDVRAVAIVDSALATNRLSQRPRTGPI